MKILVTGANGFIGKGLYGSLVQDGHFVRASVRLADSKIANVGEIAVIDSIDGKTDWTEALQDMDVVIHLAARVHVMHEEIADPLAEYRKINVDGTLQLARQAAELGIKRFIFLSSVKVNGESTQWDKPFNEEDKPEPQDSYGLSKYEAEKGLLEIARTLNMEVVIIRPPLVYGPGVKANFARMMLAVKRGLPLPFGAIQNKRSLVFIGNLISLITRCLAHPGATNQIFFVSDGQDVSTAELVRACAEAFEVSLRLVPVPQKLIELTAELLGKQLIAQRLCASLQVDSSKARSLLEWSPPFSLAQGLNATIAEGIKVNLPENK